MGISQDVVVGLESITSFSRAPFTVSRETTNGARLNEVILD